MSIATEIEQLQKNLTDSYAAVQTKGGVVPAAKGYTNLPAAITSIPTGGGGGPTWSDPHQLDSAGILTLGNTGTATFTGVKTITDKALWRCNKGNPLVTAALFPDLEVVEDSAITSYSEALTTASALGEAFMAASSLTTLKMPKLRKIGKGGLSRIMALSLNVEDVFTVYGENEVWAIFPELEEVGDFGLLEAFRWTKILEYAVNNEPDSGIIVFPKLKTLGVQAMRTAFGAKNADSSFPETADGLGAEIYFPALTTIDTSSFNQMFVYYGSGRIGLHFLSTMEETIKACAAYPTFGASGGARVELSFDAEDFA